MENSDPPPVTGLPRGGNYYATHAERLSDLVENCYQTELNLRKGVWPTQPGVDISQALAQSQCEPRDQDSRWPPSALHFQVLCCSSACLHKELKSLGPELTELDGDITS
ncbi:hypothetical protein WISP_48344 [Willisornis vidua]|uniref:Uncharacterized protein n=1 Tax=Willisornis vidua TaxID=1566151 RepID=A0ABQ9DFY8_9PASS|nr:hypothetical protein WISP_48344 [Willisornis vidua]